MAKVQRFKRTTSQIDNNVVAGNANGQKNTGFGCRKPALKSGVNLRRTADFAGSEAERKVLFKSG